MTSIVAKFFVQHIKPFPGSTATEIQLSAVCRGVENAAWSSATPAGQIKMSILNQVAVDAFDQGKEYLVTFEPVNKPAAGDGHLLTVVKTKADQPICAVCGVYPGRTMGGAITWAQHDEMFAVK